MKNSIKFGAVALLMMTIISLSAQAQESTPSARTSTGHSGIRLSIGPDASLPLGNFHDAYDWSLGGSIQADFPVVKNQLFFTVNAGFNNFFAKDRSGFAEQSDLRMIPVKAGLKYFPVSNFYVQGEAGASFMTNKSDVGANKSAAFVYAPQVGYLIPLGRKNYLDAGIRFEGNTKFTNNGKSNNLLGLRVAYAFSL